ncbi:MAG: hypothetical protein AB7G15_12335 [Alphaproteobacteria bacterium]
MRAHAAKIFGVWLTLAAAFGWPAAGQELAPFNAPRPGLAIDFSDGLRMVYRSTEGSRTTALVTYPGDTIPYPNVMQDVFWFAQRRSERNELGFNVRLSGNASVWPLQIAKRVDYTYDILVAGKPTGRGKGVLRVLGIERINVPAGAFSSWLVETDAESVFDDQRRVRAIQRYWYVADLGTYVMVERTIIEQGKRSEPQTSYATRIQQSNQ